MFTIQAKEDFSGGDNITTNQSPISAVSYMNGDQLLVQVSFPQPSVNVPIKIQDPTDPTDPTNPTDPTEPTDPIDQSTQSMPSNFDEMPRTGDDSLLRFYGAQSFMSIALIFLALLLYQSPAHRAR